MKFSDWPTIIELMALKDSSLPMPLIFASTVPMPRMTMGSRRMYCRMPISTEMKTMGISTIRKKEKAPSLTRPPNTKSVPCLANSINLVKPAAKPPTTARPTSEFSMNQANASSTTSSWPI